MIREHCQCKPDCRVVHGTCHCGCGKPTRIAPQTSTERGWTRGEPIRYIRGHASNERGDRHTLTGIDPLNRTAECSRCGLITIKLNGGSQGQWKCTGRLCTTHFLTEINAEEDTAWCRGCGERVNLCKRADGRVACSKAMKIHRKDDYSRHGEQRRAQTKKWLEANPTYTRQQHLKRKFGITLEEYDLMVEAQGGVCAICGGPPRGRGADNDIFNIDHCHATNRVRKLLCGWCNIGLGMFRDDPAIMEAAIEYLRTALTEGDDVPQHDIHAVS